MIGAVRLRSRSCDRWRPSDAGLELARLCLAAACLGAFAPGATARARQLFFQTRGGAVECELDDGGAAGIGVDAYCQTVQPQRSVTLSAAGVTLVCDGQTCIGNAPLNVRTVKPGRTEALGPFACTVGSASITCKIATGAGFSISPADVKELGPARAAAAPRRHRAGLA